ncbi:hypothetical protein [Pseudooceanicola sp.]|uniref:hypothetical protein n=1 Tax=Pseudooceanicola sp. TaxID=1914328 RepID=UPI0035C768F0
MPFIDDYEIYAPLGLPEGLDLTPQNKEVTISQVLGAAFRLENPVVSLLSNKAFEDASKPFDPDYRPWDDIQGTEYEPYAERFTGARDAIDVATMKLQLDRELEDRKTVASAGTMGFLSEMAAGLLSPTSLLPGGALVKGAKGVSIARTGLSVGTAAASAALIDEMGLQATQQVRPVEESAFAVGGSFVLGGVLGVAAGKMANREFAKTAAQIERVLPATHDLDRGLRSLSAAESGTDLKLRREGVLRAVQSVPGIGRALLGSDPLVRTMMSDFRTVRETVSSLAEPVLELEAGEAGKTALRGFVPVETRVKARRQTELAGSLANLSRFYGEYDRDGPVGMIGTFTAPVTGKWGHLVGRDQKLNIGEFSEEVAKAMRRGDKHPIPQVQNAAEAIRRDLFEKVRRDAEELGLFKTSLTETDAGSYLTRIYRVEKINAHFGDGTENDLVKTLLEHFARKHPDRPSNELETDVRETVAAIKGLRPGESAWQVTTAKPTRARVLDVPDELLEPWLEPDIRVVASRYFETMVPDIEIIRAFGDLDMTEAFRRIDAEEAEQLAKATSDKKRQAIAREAKSGRRDLKAMKDRIRGVYRLPDNPRDVWVVGSRVARTLTYASSLGGFMLSALPDLGTLVGRSGLEAAFGAHSIVTDPKRFGIALKDAADLGAAAEWYLNTRAMEIANLSDPFSSMTRTERMVGEIGRSFSIVSGVIPWNAGWKTVGGAFVSSRMAKAAEAVANGKATKSQIRRLAANGIEPWMAERIAKQVTKHGDQDKNLWLPRAGLWDDQEAFTAFHHAMTREFDLMVITPGQDKPLTFSSEAGKFFFQFKSFAWSAHHRIVLAGLQGPDADKLASIVTMLTLGVLVSNIQADFRGRERKKGVALWEDALDRSGISGWLLELHAPINAATGGTLSPSGEVVSRYGAKYAAEGLLGPSVGITMGVFEAINSASRQASGTGKMTRRDIDRLSRAVPGNNLWWLLGTTHKIEEAMAAELGIDK